MARVTAKADRIRIEMQDDGMRYEVFKEDCVDLYPILAGITEAKNGRAETLFVKMNKEGTKLYNVNPPGNKSYFCRFAGFSHEKDKPPVPRSIPSRSITTAAGKSFTFPEHMGTYAQFKIQSGDYEGLMITNEVAYAFAPYGENNTCLKGTGSKKTEEFLTVCGFDLSTEDIPYSDNLLPYIQEKILDHDILLIVKLTETSFVESITQAPEGTAIPNKKKPVKVSAPAKPAAPRPEMTGKLSKPAPAPTKPAPKPAKK